MGRDGSIYCAVHSGEHATFQPLKYIPIILLSALVALGLFLMRGSSQLEGVGRGSMNPVVEVRTRQVQDLIAVPKSEGIRKLVTTEATIDPAWVPHPNGSDSFAVLVKGRTTGIMPGFPVRLCCRKDDGTLVRAGPLNTHLALSDEAGVARFRKDVIEGMEGVRLLSSGYEWQQNSFLLVTAGQVAYGQVLFYVPDRGGLGIELVDSEGAAWLGGERVYGEGKDWRRYGKRGPDGYYWLHDLPLGEDFKFHVIDRGKDVGAAQLCAPFRAGEGVRRVSLERRAVQFRVHGIVRGEDGEAVRAGRLVVQMGRGDRVAVLTDHNGGFEWVLPGRETAWAKVYMPVEQNLRDALDAFGQSYSPHANPRDLGAWVELPTVEMGQDLDLGSIVLKKDPVLVAGRVQLGDADQEFKCEVRAVAVNPPKADAVALLAIRSGGWPVNQMRAWEVDQSIELTCSGSPIGTPGDSGSDSSEVSGSGAFRISGVYPDQRMRLDVRATRVSDGARYVASRTIEFDSGARGLVVDLIPATEKQ